MSTSKTYKELYEILSYMDKATVMKIPTEILQTIKNNKDDIFNEKNVNRETIDLLCYFYKHYWCK